MTTPRVRGSNKRQLAQLVGVRLSTDELAALNELRAYQGLSRSGYVRTLILAAIEKAKPPCSECGGSGYKTAASYTYDFRTGIASGGALSSACPRGCFPPYVINSLPWACVVTSSVLTDVPPSDLRPHESIALTVALAQLHRGDEVMPNVAAVCILALGRITGRVDYDGEEVRYSVPEPASTIGHRDDESLAGLGAVHLNETQP